MLSEIITFVEQYKRIAVHDGYFVKAETIAWAKNNIPEPLKKLGFYVSDVNELYVFLSNDIIDLKLVPWGTFKMNQRLYKYDDIAFTCPIMDEETLIDIINEGYNKLTKEEQHFQYKLKKARASWEKCRLEYSI